MLPEKIQDALIPVLDVAHSEGRHMRPAEPTAKEHRRNCPVADERGGGNIRSVHQLLGLLNLKPIPERTPFEATPFTRMMPLAISGASSPRPRRPVSDGNDPHVDRNGAEAGLRRHALTVALVNPAQGFPPERVDECGEYNSGSIRLRVVLWLIHPIRSALRSGCQQPVLGNNSPSGEYLFGRVVGGSDLRVFFWIELIEKFGEKITHRTL
ncbi:MAG TPA: hypothetical protein VME43_11605, partial [Bryobacteraceae bacterium]|nr:hypothetical protein [Bryobacteraceae bacterium]